MYLSDLSGFAGDLIEPLTMLLYRYGFALFESHKMNNQEIRFAPLSNSGLTM